jgi:hypothetical protein
MKFQRVMIGVIGAALAAGSFGIAGYNPNGDPTQMVITVRPTPNVSPTPTLEANDLAIQQGKTPAPVARLQRLTADLANMQLFILLDDSTQSSSLGNHLGELRTFLNSLPATTEVAVGYMRNGTFGPAQAFTADHQKAASALRLPEALPGANASPYFALSALAKHWPSKEPTGRRAVLMLTDGIDPYWGTSTPDDPYVDTAIHDALKNGLMVYSIYLRGAGGYGRNGWVTNFGQSHLIQVGQETGGNAYFEAFTDPVNITPFLSDFQDRLDHQYQVTIAASHEKGVQPVKVRIELPGLKIDSPTRIYVR